MVFFLTLFGGRWRLALSARWYRQGISINYFSPAYLRALEEWADHYKDESAQREMERLYRSKKDNWAWYFPDYGGNPDRWDRLSPAWVFGNTWLCKLNRWGLRHLT